MKEIKITSEYITLGQMLKLAQIIGNGGEAKMFLATNVAYVDGEPDRRRGRKLYPGMTVVVDGKSFKITQ